MAKNCQHCGFTLDDTSKFCPNCGASLAQAAPSAGPQLSKPPLSQQQMAQMNQPPRPMPRGPQGGFAPNAQQSNGLQMGAQNQPYQNMQQPMPPMQQMSQPPHPMQQPPQQQYGQQGFGQQGFGPQGQGFGPGPYGGAPQGQGFVADSGIQGMFLRYDGRLNRKPFILRSLALFAVAFTISLIAVLVLGEEVGTMVTYLAGLVVFVPGLLLSIRRLHDLDRPAWWIVGQFIPMLNTVLGIYLLCFRGTVGPNRYGPDPLQNMW